MTELAILQAIRLKGRVSPPDLAETVSLDLAEVADTVARLTAANLLVGDTTLRISPEGRVRLSELLTEERNAADATTLANVYSDFRSVNADFKALVTEWQLRGGKPNSHDDADYDAAILAQLDDVHQRVEPIIATAATQLPRLHAYSRKLSAALGRVKAGETAWLTRPLIDSYHTVWFELHEELILAVGLTREQAARSDDAQ
ncbi:MarR family transcriptional regulator [Mycobacterium ulcerans]|uniref:Uncharacterized protein n=2 Tax=Mycobacterium ulcerans TaxID=1809 RepID=A0PKN1_MYCUA|nr:hypothetical protein [Mycobacterium ulcerans]ABL02900.1 conserved hypothetical protein [Mycobacterium ulcerans Agy99]MEB3906042.1 MarR family transcriptional regulator [Mycobacterium ulcerans]MEB3910209.1 MarR family transcriptional regulator [Mycobacterium ulcerans]MEB3919962.1 MarR family transcriptional regulator [Mycobacterium ulcerans]MEB3924546.1 MarR family transcriptional regulator [Mycobacterium ulcerans]